MNRKFPGSKALIGISSMTTIAKLLSESLTSISAMGAPAWPWCPRGPFWSKGWQADAVLHGQAQAADRFNRTTHGASAKPCLSSMSFRGNHLSNTTSLTQVFFKSDE